MFIRDLRAYIAKTEDMGLLKMISGADWNLEIGGISDLYRRRKMVLFDNIKGYPKGYRVLTNFIPTEAHVKLLIGAPMEFGTLDIVKYQRDMLKKFKPVPPRLVGTGPIFENLLYGDQVDLTRFPSPRFHELDGGRYIGTACLVITKDPDEDWVNLGTYRVMVHDKTTAGSYMSPGKHGRLIREKYWSKGQSCPVAVVCGQAPNLFLASAISVPYGVSEYDYAGWLNGEPIEVVSGPVTGLPIPSTAEIVLEGEIPPPSEESRLEGPFAEWTGYYGSGARNEPVIRVKSILFRNDPILTSQSAGNVPTAHRVSHMNSAVLWDEMEKAGVPEIKGVWAMEPGASSLLTVVSVRQRYPGHARQAGLAVAGCREGAQINRLTIVVDDDINPTNEDDVWWAVATRCDPATDIEIIKGTWGSPLDPRLDPEKRKAGDFTNSRAIIYAVKPFHWMKDFPPVCRHSQEYLENLAEKFKDQVSDLSQEELKRMVSAKVYR